MKKDQKNTATDDKDSGWTGWHSFFLVAFRLEFLPDNDKIEITENYAINHDSFKADIFLVKKTKDAVLKNPLGKHFNLYNIIEYKSEDAALNLVSLWQLLTYGYGFLYTNKCSDRDLHLFLVRAGYPRSLEKEIKARGGEMVELEKGVYEIKLPIIRTFFINLKEIDEDVHTTLVAVRRNIEPELYDKVTDKAMKREKIDNPDWHAYMNAVFQANKEYIDKIRKEMNAVYLHTYEEFLEYMYGPRYSNMILEREAKNRAEGRAEGRVEGRAEGAEIGLAKVNTLYTILKDKGRSNDVLRAIDDDVFRDQLFEEYRDELKERLG